MRLYAQSLTTLLFGLATSSSVSSRHLQEDEQDLPSSDNDDFPNPSDYEFECSEECDQGYFCGRDQECHAFNCEDWYEQGHPLFTGYDPKAIVPLECAVAESRDTKDTRYLGNRPYCGYSSGLMPSVVSFRQSSACRTGGSCPSSDDLSIRTNRKCTARTSTKTGFVCYDIAPDTDISVYTASYVDATDGFGVSEPCVDGNYTGNHFYSTNFESPRVVSGAASKPTVSLNMSLVLANVISRHFEINTDSAFPFCNPGCTDTEFCGKDGLCHSYSCGNVYEYGPTEFTGIGPDDTNPGELSCSGVAPIDGKCSSTAIARVREYPILSPWPVSVSYKCNANVWSDNTSYTIFGSFPPCATSLLSDRYTTSNRYCTAKPNAFQTFSCYDIAPETDLDEYLAGYINATNTDANCTSENTSYDPLSDPEASDKTVQYSGRHSFRTCIGNSSYTDCTHVSTTFFTGESLDYVDRIRSVMTSELLGSKPDPPKSPTSGAMQKYHIALSPLLLCVLGAFYMCI